MSKKKEPMETWEAFHNCTASSLGLALICHEWIWYRYKDESSDAADLGTCYHSMVERGYCEHEDEHLVYLAEEMFEQQDIDLSHYDNEVVFSFDGNEGRSYGEISGREYLPWPEFWGTIDLVDEIEVADIKTGLPNPNHDTQLRVAALALDREQFSTYYAWLGESNLFQHRKETSRFKPGEAEDLRTRLTVLRNEILSESEENRPKPVGGAHCESHWCKRRKICPHSPAYVPKDDTEPPDEN